MEVTVKNFEELLPQIEASIDRADFLAMDCELSGLKVTDEKDNCFETMEERYLSVRNSTSQFLVIQFGLCPFFYDPATDEYSHEAYNFYTFPRQVVKNGPNIRFLCESSSLDFLANNGFDFNKLIYEGIPYLSVKELRKLKEDLEKRNSFKMSEENSTPVSVPENQKKFVENTHARISQFIASPAKELNFENLSPFQRKIIFNNIKPKYASSLYFEAVTINDEDSEQGNVVHAEKSHSTEDSSTIHHQTLAASYASKSDTEINTANISKNLKITVPADVDTKTAPVRSDKSRVLRVVKLGTIEQSARDDEKKQQDIDALTKNFGFSRIIQKMSQSGKVVVGHNMLLDICHTVSQFVEELPDNLADFKELVQDTFPNLIDTKYMCTSHPFREMISSSVLGDLAKRIQEEPFNLPPIKVPPGENSVGYELSDKKCHEAGFDAFITGCCFMGMCQHLGTLQHPKKPRVLANTPLVMPFLNKLYMMRMSEVSYLNISGTDLTPSRSHVFYVTCPREASYKNIQQIFNPFGNIQTWWKTDTSLFVALQDKDQSSLVMNNIECSSEYRVIPFATYQKLQREEKKRPLGALSESPERAGDIFRKLVCGDKSPPNNGGNHKKKRPKTEAEKQKVKQVFAEPSSWN